MNEDDPVETEVVEFELATGNHVRVAAGNFWEILTPEDRRFGFQPRRFLAIRVYSDEDVASRRLVLCEEFRVEKEFTLEALGSIWQWLGELQRSRQYLDFNELDDFLDEFAEALDRCTTHGEDCCERLAHLWSSIPNHGRPAPGGVDLPEDAAITEGHQQGK